MSISKTASSAASSQQAKEVSVDGRLLSKEFMRRGLVILLALGLLWWILINELRIEWSSNPQYSYGWLVPLLAVGLLVRRWQAMKDHGSVVSSPSSAVSSPSSVVSGQWSRSLVVFFLCAFLILPIRLFLEANPGWRTLDWLLACCVSAITLVTVYRSLGRDAVAQFAFPICLVLVAVPWPPSIETPVIQGLTQFNARMVIEVMGILGIPAIQHGNVIEVSTGVVGIDEACSGIRSFQSSLMISLFFGELYRLSLRRRLLFVPIGFGIAMLFNVCRTSLLTYVAAKKGVAAISQYHDPAGVSIMIACTLSLWGIGLLLLRKQLNEKLKLGKQKGEIGKGKEPELKAAAQSDGPRAPISAFSFLLSAFPHRPLSNFNFQLSAFLLAWLIIAEVGVEAWYRMHEMRRAEVPEWTIHWPPPAPDFKEVPVAEASREMLKYNEGHSGAWSSENGQQWFMYYFKWLPGKIASSSARSHSPNVCLVAAGKQLLPIEDNRCPITIGSLVLPFRRYEFEENGHTVQVFHCLWEEQAPTQFFSHNTQASTMGLRLSAVREGRRNLGQRSIEIMVTGIEDAKAAQASVEAQLRKMITVVRSP